MTNYIYLYHPGHFLKNEDPIEPSRVGTTFEEYENGKIVILNSQQATFHEEHPKASVKEVWDMALKERTVEDAKKAMISKIKRYDSSNIVNGFFLNGKLMWLSISERANAILTLQSAQALGIENVPYLGVTFPVDSGIMAINMVNLYAAQCVAVTESHIATVESLTDIVDIDGYDYTTGYPDRLVFDFPQNNTETNK